MGRERGKQTAYSELPIGRTNVKAEDTRAGFLLKRWKEKGNLVQPEQMMKVSPAYDILNQITLAANSYRCYVEDHYSGSSPVKKTMRDAELLRSECILHAVAVIREIMERAVENDLPDVLDRALESANAIKSCVLDSGFLRIPKKPEGKPNTKIIRTEPDEEDAKAVASYSLEDIVRKYSIIICTLAEAARKVDVRLLSVEEMQNGIPATPVMDLAVGAIN